MSTARHTTAPEVEQFINNLNDPEQQKETRQLVSLLQKATGKTPGLMSKSIIAFGMYKYTYTSGREGETCIVGFSPRKGKFSFYLTGNQDKIGALWGQLGKFKAEKGCLHVKRLSDINPEILSKIVTDAYQNFKPRLEALGVKVSLIP
jgi:hypothetical protein